ncbi:MAG: hypothetical protein ACKO1F_07240, partial [Flammeovirgaceae bacterium]
MKEVVEKLEIGEREAIQNIIANVLKMGGAFSLWRKPNSTEKVLMICNSGFVELDEISLEESVPGFVFATFDPSQKKIFLPADIVFRFSMGELQETNPDHWWWTTFDKRENNVPQKLKYHLKLGRDSSPS